jgi:formiminoglutamase
VNAINFDAHSDFRILEGRHSGNGFSYAYEEGFLKKYFIFYMKTIPQKCFRPYQKK